MHISINRAASSLAAIVLFTLPAQGRAQGAPPAPAQHQASIAPHQDPLVGTYVSSRHDFGTTRFESDGTVDTITGLKGTWSPIDRRLGIYSVSLGESKFTVIMVSPGHLASPDQDNYVFLQPR